MALAAVHVATSPGLPIDLEVYRRAGEAVLGGGDAVYQGGDGQLPFTYPPFSAALFTALALVPPGAATVAVAALSYLGLSTIVALSVRHLDIDRRLGVPIVLLAALTEPVAETVRFGQVNLILAAALVLLDLLVLMPRRSRAAGLLVAIAICIKLTPAVFLLLPLVRREWRILARTAAASAVLTIVPALVMPASWLDFWTRAVWSPERVGGVEFLSNQSIKGAVWRAAGPGGFPVVTALLVVTVVLITLVAVQRAGERDAIGTVLLVALCGLLISPISWIHHWVWTVPLVLWLVSHRDAGTGRRPAVLLTLAAAWLVVLLTRVVWLAPSGDGREHLAPVVTKLLSDAYTLLALATLGAAAAIQVAGHKRNTPAHRVITPDATGASSR